MNNSIKKLETSHMYNVQFPYITPGVSFWYTFECNKFTILLGREGAWL